MSTRRRAASARALGRRADGSTPRKILAWGNISSSLVLTMRIWSCEASSRDMRRVEHRCSQVRKLASMGHHLT
eukprot:5348741-Prymnesium_polylepis.1